MWKNKNSISIGGRLMPSYVSMSKHPGLFQDQEDHRKWGELPMAGYDQVEAAESPAGSVEQ